MTSENKSKKLVKTLEWNNESKYMELYKKVEAFADMGVDSENATPMTKEHFQYSAYAEYYNKLNKGTFSESELFAELRACENAFYWECMINCLHSNVASRMLEAGVNPNDFGIQY